MNGGDLRTGTELGVFTPKFYDQSFQLIPLQSKCNDLRLEIVEGGLHAGAAEVGEPFRQNLGVGKRVVTFRKRDDSDVLLVFFLVLIGEKGLREVAGTQ